MHRYIQHGTRAIGLATTLAAAPLAWSADGDGLTLSWSNATKWSGGPNAATLKLGSKVQVIAFDHDVDREWNQDQVRRQFVSLNDALSTPPTAAEAQTFLQDAGDAYAGAERAFADGIEVDDAEFYLKGEAYDNIIFKIQFEGAKSDTNVELDKWYLGLKDVPALGNITIREVDEDRFHYEGNFYEDSVVTHAFEKQELIGLQVDNEYLDGRLGFYVAAGINDVNERGGSDKNWDFQGRVWGIPYDEDQSSLKLSLDFEVHNPSGSDHDAFDEFYRLRHRMTKGPTLIDHNMQADEVKNVAGVASFVYGRLNVGGLAVISDVETVDSPNELQAPMVQLIASAGADPVSYVDHTDGTFEGFSAWAAFSLTGEQQSHGKGIKKPKANLAWDGSGYGAFELLARVAVLDIQENTADRLQLLNFATATQQDIMNVIINQTQNRQEGGESRVFEIGLNWYPAPKAVIGLFFASTRWEYDNGAVDLDNQVVTGVSSPVNIDPNDLLGLTEFVVQDQIENDYKVDTFYFSTLFKF